MSNSKTGRKRFALYPDRFRISHLIGISRFHKFEISRFLQPKSTSLEALTAQPKSIFLCFILSSDSRIVGSIVNDLDVETLSISMANKLKVEVCVNQFNKIVFLPLFLSSLEDLLAVLL